MEGLDLDINNYTINDIEKFFKFRPKSTYSASDVELREAQIREQLLQSGHVKGKYKRDLMAFLTEAKEWLVEARCPQTRPPTTLGKDYPHDSSPYPHTKHLPSPPGREGELTSRPETQYIYTQDSQFLPGNLNPLKTRVISKCLTIDTRFRDNYNATNSTDFTFQMPLKLN